MYNYRLEIEYDGGRYDGWQRLGKDAGTNTVERKLIEIISRMTGEYVEMYVGSRTEKGVHALCQTANFKLEKEVKPIELRNYLNRYLPRDIAVTSVSDVPERFHSQLNAQARIYEYRLDTGNVANVFRRKYAYHTFDEPDYDAMRKAAAYFEGKHDFKAFTTARKSKSTVRDIKQIRIQHEGAKAYIRIEADDFLHNMARYIIGMLLDVGNGLKKPEDVKACLEGKDIQMSLPAESYGLFLIKVVY